MWLGGDFGKEKAKTTFHRVLIEQILPQFLDRDNAMDLLEEHVTNNLLKVSGVSRNTNSRWGGNSTDRRLEFPKGQ